MEADTTNNIPENEKTVLISTQEQAIRFSNSLLKALKQKAKGHNEKYNTRVTANQLERVYSEGTENHNEYESKNHTKNECGIAKVNSFLKLTTGDMKVSFKVKKIEVNVSGQTFILSNALTPSEEDFSLAEKDIKEYDLNFDFNTIEDLFLHSLYTKTNLYTWI